MKNETEKLTDRILAACQEPPRVSPAHSRAIALLLETLTDTSNRYSPIKQPTLAQMAETLAEQGLDYGNDGIIHGIRVLRKGGHDCVVFTTDGVWLNLGTLLGIVEDFGRAPDWWQHGWTEVRRGGVWIERESVHLLSSDGNG